ncbi:MAG: Dipeptidylaminopeptidase/acylaminoacyl-peptidase [uncultured bacterium]|uniref:Serine aminopeptidase S33 domain-containing protein n=1 Tax=Candidatus Woesebacteria bacterium RIFCSPHIGHO2_12_FULL_41_24 TaxID=1802510 RepID=A0A1F8AUP4_9BACT|nr:MAG: Dipeptidylaminopeptidase/acylaminoacyl-peptidase [uncultured bacterium]OGM14818.1 MAG: hypothetical protein A2W15_00570 [Candidatus Woesebacteria bacterium RBG_16_41_13]OGM30310.1 MAG: hypothetical protein A2873_05275 [Candidatus Woesebacteria bacterium RIFCSPHIGHO2_01_FULL_42_80]OGM34349.1 MAG: hypothetical protein A3D84_04855 [Candidatus Woesebacteria bacterium RIFCSPHIGHO2_02_FULL_42_20]OGM55483.1 MAG: hypothetical protein A3E44_01010 [Candidatus Woesebacteria bacterium RIFCSPHIGHO2_
MSKKLLGFVTATAVIFYVLSRMQISVSTGGVSAPQKTSEPVNSISLEFRKITLPYLRERTYESKLGNLEKYSENTQYTSYLTSYNSDGLKINGLITVPSTGSPPWPAIIFIHGYIPPASYKTTANYNSYVDYLAKNGFVVFKIDLRGHAKSEGVASGAYYSGDYIIDTLNARAALFGADFVDQAKIGLWGHSMAGNIVFRSLVALQDIRAVVIWAGAVYSYEDMQKYRISDNSYQPPPQESERRKKREELRNTHGDFNPTSDFWYQVVPTNYLAGVGGAVQIHHAVDDGVVNIGYSRDLMEILDDTKISHELFEYPSGGHNLTGLSFTTAMQRTVEFFKENL